jgi:hypothetical protein
MIFHRRALPHVAACTIAAFAVNAGAVNSQQTKMTTCCAQAVREQLPQGVLIMGLLGRG